MTTIFKNYDTNICFNGSYLFYEHNINVSYSIMIKLWTMQCYSINKLNGSLKLFAEFSLSAIISEKFPWVFQIFPDFSNFPNFSLIFQVLPECCEPCILYISLFQPLSSENLGIRNCQFDFMVLLVCR